MRMNRSSGQRKINGEQEIVWQNVEEGRTKGGSGWRREKRARMEKMNGKVRKKLGRKGC